MQQARAGQIKATKEVILIRLAQEDERRNAYPGEEERLPWTFASTPGSLTQSDILCPGHLSCSVLCLCLGKRHQGLQGSHEVRHETLDAEG